MFSASEPEKQARAINMKDSFLILLAVSFPFQLATFDYSSAASSQKKIRRGSSRVCVGDFHVWSRNRPQRASCALARSPADHPLSLHRAIGISQSGSGKNYSDEQIAIQTFALGFDLFQHSLT